MVAWNDVVRDLNDMSMEISKELGVPWGFRSTGVDSYSVEWFIQGGRKQAVTISRVTFGGNDYMVIQSPFLPRHLQNSEEVLSLLSGVDIPFGIVVDGNNYSFSNSLHLNDVASTKELGTLIFNGIVGLTHAADFTENFYTGRDNL